MRIYGFSSVNWGSPTNAASGDYWFVIDPKNTLLPSVTPQILLRPGNYATFGVSQVGAMNIVGKFAYRGPLPRERAWFEFFQQINVANAVPRQIRAVRQDGTLVTLMAVLSVPNFATLDSADAKDATFVCVRPFFDAAGTLVGGGSF